MDTGFMQSGKADPYCQVYLSPINKDFNEDEKETNWKTKVRKETLNPKWN